MIKVKMKDAALKTYVLRDEKGNDVGAIDIDAEGLFRLPDNVAESVIAAGEGEQVGEPESDEIKVGGDAPGATA